MAKIPSWAVPGRRVVRVDFETKINRRFQPVLRGQVVTVAVVKYPPHRLYAHVPCISFVETNPKHMWPARMFRPVRETSIESLRALLSPSPSDVRRYAEELADTRADALRRARELTEEES